MCIYIWDSKKLPKEISKHITIMPSKEVGILKTVVSSDAQSLKHRLTVESEGIPSSLRLHNLEIPISKA